MAVYRGMEMTVKLLHDQGVGPRINPPTPVLINTPSPEIISLGGISIIAGLGCLLGEVMSLRISALGL